MVVCGVVRGRAGNPAAGGDSSSSRERGAGKLPSIPATLAETIGRYTENRDAFQTDWHPTRREMIIGTRFGNTYQAHMVKMPGGARQQLTFFPEPVLRRLLSPEGWKLFVVSKRCGR
jgi:hypothetical protein